MKKQNKNLTPAHAFALIEKKAKKAGIKVIRKSSKECPDCGMKFEQDFKVALNIANKFGDLFKKWSK